MTWEGASVCASILPASGGHSELAAELSIGVWFGLVWLVWCGFPSLGRLLPKVLRYASGVSFVKNEEGGARWCDCKTVLLPQWALSVPAGMRNEIGYKGTWRKMHAE